MTLRVGVLGAGQLGWMLALAGAPLGLRFRFVDPNPDAPAGRLAELIVADYEDPAALDALAECDRVSYEFESVPVAAVEALGGRVLVCPGARALGVAQDRALEKAAFARLGIPTAEFLTVASDAELERACASLGLPAVLKTRRLGYDGKGQVVLRHPQDIAGAFDAIGRAPAILERLVPFDRELSVIAVRSERGEIRSYGLTENTHRDGILHLSLAPAPNVTPALERRAGEIIGALLEELDYVGVLALELFQMGSDLLANEMAPRVHNSGHWTIDGARTSQFENHLRAVCGLPLGATDALGPAGMLNLVGHVPPARELLAIEDAHLYDYGKAPRPRRKVGHLTVRGPTLEAVRNRLAIAEQSLAKSNG